MPPYYKHLNSDILHTSKHSIILHNENHNFISYKGKKNIKSALRRQYTQARELFDKALKRAERAYKKSVANDIENELHYPKRILEQDP